MCINRKKSQHREQGATLLEMILTIVVLGAAVAGGIMLLLHAGVKSANLVYMKQSSYVAESMMRELIFVAQQSGDDDDGILAYNNAQLTGFELTGDPSLASYIIDIHVTPQSMGGIPAEQSFQVEIVVTDPHGHVQQMTQYIIVP